MAYKYDTDLEFLRELESAQLNELVEILKGKAGDERFTQFLTSNDLFKRFYPEHKEYIELIMAELQEFGGNSFANIFRGGGVKYKEILCDACDELKVNYNKNSDILAIEQNMFMKILTDSVSKMNEGELKELVSKLKLKTTNFSSNAVVIALQAGIKGAGFISYKVALIVANAVAKAVLGKGLTIAANATLTRAISVFAGPIGWVLTGIWTAADIAGPAYRVTIPAVIQVAFLRQVYLNRQNEIDKLF